MGVQHDQPLAIEAHEHLVRPNATSFVQFDQQLHLLLGMLDLRLGFQLKGGQVLQGVRGFDLVIVPIGRFPGWDSIFVAVTWHPGKYEKGKSQFVIIYYHLSIVYFIYWCFSSSMFHA